MKESLSRLLDFRGPLAMTFLVGVLLASDRRAEAGLTLVSSSGSVTYGTFATTAGSTSTVFKTDSSGNNTVLISPGNNLPMLNGLAAGTMAQNQSATTLSPYFLTTANSSILGSSYGSATTETYVATSGQQGGFTTQGGVYWSLNTQLSDNLAGTTNEAAVSFSISTATYSNYTNSPITFNPGAILSISGTLGDTSSYIAAGLATSLTIDSGESVSNQVLDTVTLAANGQGATIAKHGAGQYEFASVTAIGNTITGTGTSLGASNVTLYTGDTVVITSYLTLISDPGSSIGISDTLAAGFPNGPQYIPTFGTFASSPTAVPEPASLVLVGTGLALAGLVNRSNRRRSPVSGS